MIIGLTGPNASGKGEAALHFKAKGYIHYSLSDILREESRLLNIEPSRKNLIELGNKLRKEYGPSVLAARTIKKLSSGKDYVIDSIRNPSEIEALRNLDDFILLGINAPVELRFRRNIERNREGDAVTLEDFIKKEELENKNKPENQQLNRCIEMADKVIINDAGLETFYKNLDEAISNK